MPDRLGKPSPDLTVVIPCCDEEAAVGRFESELFPALEGLGAF